jgi:anaerobic magnesium-protoporphyrin IX monomethyl ester cyclase
MNVILTHGYFLHQDVHESGVMKPYPPVGLLFLSAWLKQHDIPHQVYDTTFSDMKTTKAWLEHRPPGLIGFYATLMTRLNILEIIAFIRGSHSLAGTKIVIGGPDARYHAGNYLGQGADFVIPGEGEGPLADVIHAFSEGHAGRLHEIRGICFPDSEGRLVSTGERDLLDPQEIPFPEYEQINVPRYLQQWKASHGFSSMTVNSMRGCPYSCNWCSKAVFGNTYRRRNPAVVVEEMIRLRDAFHPDQIWFTDDVFTISKDWLRQFMFEVQARNAVLPYECITRADCMDDEIIGWLNQSGCRKVWIGAESGSQHVINLMNRRIDLDRTEEMMIRLKNLGISTGTFIMLGYHGEARKDIFSTAGFLKRTLPDELTVGTAYPIKGTKYYETVEPLFERPYDWKSGSERQIRFRKPFSDRFYRFAGRYLMNLLSFKQEPPGLRKWAFWMKAVAAKFYISWFS